MHKKYFPLNVAKKGRQRENWAIELRTGGKHWNPIFIKGRGQYALTSHPFITELLLAFRNTTYVLIMLFCFLLGCTKREKIGHICRSVACFLGISAGHWQVIQTWNCNKNARKLMIFKSLLSEKTILFSNSLLVSRQVLGLPLGQLQHQNISLTNTHACILHYGMSPKCFGWLHI